MTERRYDEVYARSMADPQGFWAEAAAAIDWQRRWDAVLDDSGAPIYRWFRGGVMNTCHNCLDRHVAAGRGDQPALIWESPVTNAAATVTYAELLDQVSRFAGALQARGIGKGDRVLIYMPMILPTAVAMLACARLGAIHSVVFGGFAPHELVTRIDDAKPKAIVTASCGVEPGRIVEYVPMVNEALAGARHKVDFVVCYQRRNQVTAELTPGRDVDWDEAMAGAEPAACVPVEATDPLYIIYTSGTTGQPKGIVRDNGGHAVVLKWSMKAIYDVDPGEVFWAASDVGWVVGHSYIVYGPLLHGATGIMFEGKPVGTPDPGVYWRIISQYGVKKMFTAPTAFRAIRQQDPKGDFVRKYDLSRFKILFLAGERADPDTIKWAEQQLKVPVIDHWWQTESGWPMAANCMGLGPFPVKYGSPTKAVPGFDLQVLGEDHQPKPPGELGDVVAKLPLPPGCAPTLWQAAQRYQDAYLSQHPGYYHTADAGYLDEDGYIYIMARTDDIINVAGHRLSTGAMEEVLASHPDVAETAVIGVADQLKGELPLGLVVLKAGVDRPEADIRAELVALVRKQIGPVAAFRSVGIIKRLPKTRSGKVLRGTMKAIADQQSWRMPATIDDPAILDEITVALEDLGYASKRPS
jgi:propionyl-CoA synthetase